MAKPKPKRGRPSSYTEEKGTAICDRIISGESLRSICRDKTMPDEVTVTRWQDRHEAFRTQFARAREAQAEGWMDEIVEISDSGSEEDVQHRKLRLDARKFAIIKILPRKYGDRAQVEHSGTLTLAQLVEGSYKKDGEK